MTQQEKTILDQQLKGVTYKLVWGFVCSIVIGTFTVCACYFRLDSKVSILEERMANMQEQIRELKVSNVAQR